MKKDLVLTEINYTFNCGLCPFIHKGKINITFEIFYKTEEDFQSILELSKNINRRRYIPFNFMKISKIQLN